MRFPREGIFGVVQWVQGLVHAQAGKSGVTYAGQTCTYAGQHTDQYATKAGRLDNDVD